MKLAISKLTIGLKKGVSVISGEVTKKIFPYIEIKSDGQNYGVILSPSSLLRKNWSLFKQDYKLEITGEVEEFKGTYFIFPSEIILVQ